MNPQYYGQTGTNLTGAAPPERIERDIESTRSVIREDLRALGEKLSPEHLKHEAMEAVKHTAGSARDAIMQPLGQVGDRVQRASEYSRDRLREGTRRLKGNPLALAGSGIIIGLGIGVLLPRSEAETRLLAKPARKARVQARELLDEGRETARKVRGELEDATTEVKQALRDAPRIA